MGVGWRRCTLRYILSPSCFYFHFHILLNTFQRLFSRNFFCQVGCIFFFVLWYSLIFCFLKLTTVSVFNFQVLPLLPQLYDRSQSLNPSHQLCIIIIVRIFTVALVNDAVKRSSIFMICLHKLEYLLASTPLPSH